VLCYRRFAVQREVAGLAGKDTPGIFEKRDNTGHPHKYIASSGNIAYRDKPFFTLSFWYNIIIYFLLRKK
jgi:hypothetical protein